MKYLTRVRMNASDERMIDDHPEWIQDIGRGTACIPHKFEHSGKTNYLFFYFEPDESGKMQYTFSESYEEHQAAYE